MAELVDRRGRLVRARSRHGQTQLTLTLRHQERVGEQIGLDGDRISVFLFRGRIIRRQRTHGRALRRAQEDRQCESQAASSKQSDRSASEHSNVVHGDPSLAALTKVRFAASDAKNPMSQAYPIFRALSPLFAVRNDRSLRIPAVEGVALQTEISPIPFAGLRVEPGLRACRIGAQDKPCVAGARRRSM